MSHAALLLCLATFGGVDAELAAKIEERGFRKIGVVEWLYVEPSETRADQGDGSETMDLLTHEFGPFGVSLCGKLRESLEKLAQEHRQQEESAKEKNESLQVISVGAGDPSLPKHAVLRDAQKLQQWGKTHDLDALVVAKLTPRTKSAEQTPTAARDYTLRVALLDLTKGEVAQTFDYQYVPSLSDAAYRGESFEARRWRRNGNLTMIGFTETAAREYLLGRGRGYEEYQYGHLAPAAEHPLLAETPPPYHFEIVVAGPGGASVARPWETIGNRVYVQLEPGERFAVRLTNDSDHQLCVGVYLDGVNSLGETFEHPLETSYDRHWGLKPHSVGYVSGWTTLDGNRAHTRGFRLVPKGESLAWQQRTRARFGMITCIFYTNGMNGLPAPTGLLASRGIGATFTEASLGADGGDMPVLVHRGVGSAFAVGGDEQKPVEANFLQGERGLMLAAMTVHYRTGKELQNLRNLVGLPGEDGQRNRAK